MDAPDFNGCTALMMAASADYWETVEVPCWFKI